MIDPVAIEDYLSAVKRDSAKYKRMSDGRINKLFKKYVKHRKFGKFKPRRHQKVTMILMHKYDRYLALLAMGLGKALRNGTKVLTPVGYKNIESLRFGDFVISGSGKPTKVIGVYPQGRKRIYRVSFTDETTAECCEDHLWTVRTPADKHRNKPWRVLPLKDFKDNLQSKSGNNNWFIPILNEPVKLQDKPLSIHPYLMGALLGNAHFGRSIGFATKSKWQLAEISKYLPDSVNVKSSNEIDHRLSVRKGCKNNPLLNQVRALGLDGTLAATKFIPKEYLWNTPENRLALLQGLMDTDGWIAEDGCCTEYCSASIELAKGIKFLVESLCGQAWQSIKYVNGKPYYYVRMMMPKGISVFRIPRKKKRLPKLRKYEPSRGIKSVELVGEDECTCIKVADSSGTFCIENFVVTHNTFITLHTLRSRRKKFKRALVLVPSVANIGGWIDQVAEHTPDLTINGITGTKAQRYRALHSNTDITVMTYMGLLAMVCDRVKIGKKKRKMVVDPKLIKAFATKFDCMVIDESSKAANNESMTTKALKKLSPSMKMVYALTGTPFGRDLMDLFSQFLVVDGGETFGKFIGIFRAAFFKETPKFWGGYDYKLKKKMRPKLMAWIRNRAIRYSAKECLDLPPAVRTVRKVQLSTTAERKYAELVEEFAKYRKNHKLSEQSFIRMRQLTSGFVVAKDDTKSSKENRLEIPLAQNPKLDELVEIINETPEDSKVIVFNQFKFSGAAIEERLKKKGIKCLRLFSGTKNKQETVREFTKDKSIKVLICSSTGAYGLNIQAANYNIFYESPVDPKERQQMEARSQREGQKKTVFIIDVVVENSVDEKILAFIREGRNLLKSIVDGENVFETPKKRKKAG